MPSGGGVMQHELSPRLQLSCPVQTHFIRAVNTTGWLPPGRGEYLRVFFSSSHVSFGVKRSRVIIFYTFSILHCVDFRVSAEGDRVNIERFVCLVGFVLDCDHE